MPKRHAVPTDGFISMVAMSDGNPAIEVAVTADAAMYRAKRQQTGHAFFDDLSDKSKVGALQTRRLPRAQAMR